MAPAGVLGGLHARLERRHQVDHLRRRRPAAGASNSSPAALRLDEVEHLLAVLVAVLLGLELGRQATRRAPRPSCTSLSLTSTSSSASSSSIASTGSTTSSANTIVRIISRPSIGPDRGDVLLVAHHEPADRHLAAVLHRPRQQHVGLGRLVGRHDVRRCRSRPGRSRRGRRTPRGRSLLVADGMNGSSSSGSTTHVAALGDLVALDDVLVGHLLAGLGRDLLAA